MTWTHNICKSVNLLKNSSFNSGIHSNKLMEVADSVQQNKCILKKPLIYVYAVKYFLSLLKENF